MENPKTYKCPVCGGAVPASSGKRIKQRYYHEKCYERKISSDLAKEAEKKTQTKKRQREAVVPRSVPEDEAKERERFFQKVKRLTGNTKLSAKTYALADKYKRDYKFSWNGMEKTLIYVYELEECEISDEIIGIIPWKYTEANQFYDSLDQISPAGETLSELYEVKRIKIRPKKDEKPSIDISQLGV